MDWFRSHHGAPTDPKWLAIAARAESKPGVVAAFWWSLMDHASQASPRGSVETFDVEAAAAFFGWPEEELLRVWKALEDKKLIEGGALRTWAKRQPRREREDDLSTDRVNKHREVKRRATPCNAMQRLEERRGDKSRGDASPDPYPSAEKSFPATASLQARTRPALEKLVRFVGESHRPYAEAISEMPGAGKTWAQGVFADWGETAGMQGERIPQDIRARVLAEALKRYSTDRDRWYGPGFAKFVSRAHTDLLADLRAAENEMEARERGTTTDVMKARLESDIERLNTEARSAQPFDTDALIAGLAKAKSMKPEAPRGVA